ncbi:thioesterase II family protein [Streptococcus ferus]|uniref:thioesterase II family protein n=1 Tax=Streptococcus ferus TaxID=1345 RepID=UPI002357E79A|nr:alpha/beta fold hydrolase [Streptococcus ferus]
MVVRLYLLPYAGADISCFSQLVRELEKQHDENLKIIPIELRGHGTRRNEPPYQTMEEAINDVSDKIKFNDGLVILYGHCTGGIIAHAIYQYRKSIGKDDIGLVVLGSSIINKMNMGRFTEYLKDHVRNIFPNLSENIISQLIEYQKPLIESEYAFTRKYLMQSQIYLDKNQVFIFGKDDDFVDYKSLYTDYKELKGANVSFVPGGHFFINDFPNEVVKILNKEIPKLQFRINNKLN